MNAQKLKLEFPGTSQTAEPAAEGARPAVAGRAPRLDALLLALEKLTGVALGSIAVSIQVGNVLVCVSMLLLGPAVIIGLLPA